MTCSEIWGQLPIFRHHGFPRHDLEEQLKEYAKGGKKEVGNGLPFSSPNFAHPRRSATRGLTVSRTTV